MKRTLIFGILLNIIIVGSALADWSMFQSNSAHTGKVNVLASQTDNLEWSLDLRVDISPYGGPSIGNFTAPQQIIIGADDGVYIINSNGILSEYILTSAPIQTVIAIINHTIYFGAGDTLYAYQDTGLYWSYELNGDISHVTIYQDTVYVCDEDRLYSFSLAGDLHWMSADLSGSIIYAAPAVDASNNIYVVSSQALWRDYNLYAYYPNGNLLWQYDYLGFEANGVQMTPTLDDSGNVYIATYWTPVWSSSIQSLQDGDRNWTRDSETLHSSPAIGSDNTLYYGVNDGLEARHTNGNLVWIYYTDAIKYSSPAIGADTTIYVGTETGLFLAITSSGTLKWSANISSNPLSSPAITSSGTIYVTAGQTLFAFTDTNTNIDPGHIKKRPTNVSISPNPFNSTAIINYYLPSDALIQIKLYDVLGRLQKNLVNQYQTIGQHQVHLSGLASGVYFVRIQSDNYFVTKKAIVIK